MVIGRIYAKEKDKGSGFALAARIVVTANHVVRDQEESALQFVLDDGQNFQVENVDPAETLDVAALHLGEDVPEVMLSVGPAMERLAWQIESQPLGNDPLLTGIITTARRRLVIGEEHEIEAVQLLVDQPVGDYQGYSGSAVALRAPYDDVVFGVLIEQLPLRVKSRLGDRPQPASNVLYAVPIQDVLERFRLPELQEQYHEQYSRLMREANLLRIHRPISEVDPFEEGLVFRSALAERDYPEGVPTYIPRGDRGDRDRKLVEALTTEQFVLITGTSKAGKTRTAFEAARRMQPEPNLLIPASPGALPKLLSFGVPVDHSRPSVLWLDDLDRYLENPGMNRALFDDLRKHRSRIEVLATITWTAYDRLSNSEGEIGRSAQEILDLFRTEINFPNELSPSEREEARRLYPSQRFVAGIGEHFAAARELIKRFKAALEVHRHGFAAVVAALDWHRAGLSRPITEAELRELYSLNLKRFFLC